MSARTYTHDVLGYLLSFNGSNKSFLLVLKFSLKRLMERRRPPSLLWPFLSELTIGIFGLTFVSFQNLTNQTMLCFLFCFFFYCFRPIVKAFRNESLILACRYVSPSAVRAELNLNFTPTFTTSLAILKHLAHPKLWDLSACWRRFLELLASQSRPLDGGSLHSQKLKTAAVRLPPSRRATNNN